MADGSTVPATDGFDALFRRHRASLLAFVLRLARNEHVAADVCQQTWLKFLEAARKGRYQLSDGTGVRAYLLKVARNVYVDEYVRNHNVCRVECADSRELEQAISADADYDSVERSVEKAQLQQLTHEALATLPPLQTQVLQLWAGGLTPTAVAQSAQAPRDTVLSRKKYGFAKMRCALLARGITADLVTAG